MRKRRPKGPQAFPKATIFDNWFYDERGVRNSRKRLPGGGRDKPRKRVAYIPCVFRGLKLIAVQVRERLRKGRGNSCARDGVSVAQEAGNGSAREWSAVAQTMRRRMGGLKFRPGSPWDGLSSVPAATSGRLGRSALPLCFLKRCQISPYHEHAEMW